MPYHGLTDNELLFGYKEIVLYYETQVKNNSKGFNKKRLNQLLSRFKIIVDCGVNTPLSFYNLGRVKKSFIHFAASKYDLPMLLAGLRHAYSHANIEKKKIGGKYYLCFYNLYRSKYRMVGQIPYSHLKELVLEIKDSRII